MKIAVIGSRSLCEVDLEKYMPVEVTEIVSGGAKGVDQCARAYATDHGLVLTEFLPDYSRYGLGAPLRRNEEIVRYADMVLAVWDGKSSGTRHVINLCNKLQKKMMVIEVQGGTEI